MITFTSWNNIPDDFEGQCYIEISKAECWLGKKRKLHRKDGPAVISDNGDIQWYFNNEQHRLDGPAGIYPFDNTIVFYIFGIKYDETNYWNHPLVLEFKLKNI